MIVAALATIGQAQGEIMHALSFLAMECGEEIFPSIRGSVDKYSEWLMAHHGVVIEGEPLIPRAILVVPPFTLDVL